MGGALANLAEFADLSPPLPDANTVYRVLIATAVILISVHAFLFAAVIFHAPAFRGKFLKIWPIILFLYEQWPAAPFLLLLHINFELAPACTTFLVTMRLLRSVRWR